MAENIHQAVNAVMREVGYVQKQKSAQLNYSYAGEAALIAALRPSMVEHGVYSAVVAITDVVRGEYTTSRGNTMQAVDLTATIRFTHAPSETHIDVVALGSGADSGDKASNKALTGAYKYALRQTFSIETGDDPDAAHEERASKQAAKTASKQADKPAADKNGGKPNPLRTRLEVVMTEALALGIIDAKYKVDPAASDADLTRRGTDLAAKIKAKKEAANG